MIVDMKRPHLRREVKVDDTTDFFAHTCFFKERFVFGSLVVGEIKSSLCYFAVIHNLYPRDGLRLEPDYDAHPTSSKTGAGSLKHELFHLTHVWNIYLHVA